MKIYGVGVLHAPGTSRVVHDFIDGPFDTVNPVLIQEARRMGFSFTPPATEEPKDTPKKRGRPRSKNVNA
jgi:hypothetical protein